MSYVDSSLVGDEKVLYRPQISWGILVWPVLWTVVSFGAFLPITSIWMILEIIYVTTTEIAVTNRKVIAKWGFLRRTTIEQRLQRIDSVTINQGMLGGMLGYGAVAIRGSGESLTPMKFVNDPLTLKRWIDRAIDGDFEDGAKPAAALSPATQAS